MLPSLSADLSNRLSCFSHRKLNKPELVLFAKAVADQLPLAPLDTENIALFTLNHRSYVDECLYSLSGFSYIDNNQTELIYELVNQFSLWRYTIAHKPAELLFSGETDRVIDELSYVSRFVDQTYLCSLTDIADRATWFYRMFKDLVSEVKTFMPTKGA